MATAVREIDALPDAVTREVEDYLLANQRKSLLRFITCGSVDDGKSTLIGRLLYDSKMLLEDQLTALEADSRKSGTQGEALDFALLVDGLAAEREQGITIDVAYRFFSTDKRKFIVADTPGHEHYTRNMVTGASTADLAIILIDARQGVLTQTRRHSYLVNLLGIGNIVLAINKMDLIGYDKDRFDAIVADYAAFAEEAGIGGFTPIPVSGLQGDNVTAPSANMDWYEGPPLLDHLEQVPVGGRRSDSEPFRMAVQWVNRPNQNFRGYSGTIGSGGVKPGDRVTISPSGQTSIVERIVTLDGDLDVGMTGQAVTLTLADQVDCSRGDMIAGDSPKVSERLEADLVWMSAEALVPGRAYWLKVGTQTVSASVSRVLGITDVNRIEQVPGRPLELNDIGRCEILLDRPVPALPYEENKRFGGFILIDRAGHATVAAGMIRSFPDVSQSPVQEGGTGRIVWLTGPSADARLNFAQRAKQRLDARGRTSFILDPEELRLGLGSDLGNSETDQAENRRRVREVAKLMSRAGVTVLVALDVPQGEEKPGTQIDISDADYADSGDWVI